MIAATAQSGAQPLSLGPALLLGTLAVGILDGLDAVVFFGLRNGVAPDRILQVDRRRLARPAAARQGGWEVVLLAWCSISSFSWSCSSF